MTAAFDFREEWRRTEVTTTSPNEQVVVTLVGDQQVRVWLAPGYYERASRNQIEEQLASTARLVFVERTRAFFELRSRERGEPVLPGRTAVTRENAEYQQRLEELAVSGESDDGAVSVQAVGMTRFTVRIAPGTLERVSADAFARDAEEAATRLIEDQLDQAFELRLDVYSDAAL